MTIPDEPGPADLPVRPGAPPSVSDAGHQEQLTQTAPKELQERLLRYGAGLLGVRVGSPGGNNEGHRGLNLSPKLAEGPLTAFLSATEFAHMHPGYDGSLHVALPAPLTARVIKAGWGFPGFRSGVVLLFGPRDDTELVVATALIRSAYRFARNLPDVDDLSPETC